MSGLNVDYYKEERRLIRKARENKKLVIFVGAGASLPSGMPNWKQAIDKFKEHLYLGKNEEQNDYFKIPQLYYNARGEKEYVELARSIFRCDEALRPSEIHRRVIEFNVQTIVTTNYDNLLEKAATEQGEFLQCISQNQDIPYRTAEKEIVKIHGDFEHGNFVLKEDDYLNYHENFKLMEVYIKSLIANNVILFVGYSFSDPDIKQLFNWVKSVLGNNFQRAYMIEAFHEYNENDFEYYKNLGVNVIYASKIEGENFDKNFASQYVVDILDYILDADKTTNAIEEIYNYLKPFEQWNYVLKKYIQRAFGKYGFFLEGDSLISVERDSGDMEASKILHVLLSEQTDDKVELIKRVLAKSCLLEIRLKNINEKYEIHKGKEKDLLRKYYEFDNEALLDRKKKNDLSLSVENPKLYLEQAYICYWLQEYIEAYKYLKQASAICHEQKLYQWYFVAELNRYYLGKIIERENFKTDKEDVEKIKAETEKMQLDRILSKVPNMGSEENKFLEELYTFRINYMMFQDIFSGSQKVVEEANTSYFIYTGLPAYWKLSIAVQDYFKYLEENFIMLDRYRECVEIFRVYIDSYLESFGKGDKTSKSVIDFQEHNSNIRAEQLGVFEIFLIIRYWESKKLIEAMEKYSIKLIKVDDSVHAYLKKIFPNLLKQRNKKIFQEDKFYVFLTLVTKINLDSEFVEQIINGLSNYIDQFDIVRYKETILNFLIENYNRKKLKSWDKTEIHCTMPALGNLLTKILEQLSQDNEKQWISSIQYISSIYNKVYGSYTHNIVNKLLERGVCIETLVLLYPICCVQVKEDIKSAVTNYMEDADGEALLVYHDSIINKIIEPEERYEKKILRTIQSEQTKNKKSYPSLYDKLLIDMLNLYLNQKIILQEEYRKLFTQCEDKEVQFLSSMETFDYQYFELEWMLCYSKNLIETIANNESAGLEVRRKFKEYFTAGYKDEKLLKIYFEHFT